MRIAAAVLPALFFLTGCQFVPAEYLEAPKDYVQVTLDPVVAEDCDKTCDTVSVHVTVKNTSNELVCVPHQYEEGGIAFALIFVYDDHSLEPVGINEPTDPSYIWSPRYKEDMQTFKKWSQVVVQPHSQIQFEQKLYRKYELAPGPAKAWLRFMAYPCSEKLQPKWGDKILNLMSEVRYKVK